MTTTSPSDTTEFLLADPSDERILQAVSECSSDIASIRDRTVILKGIVRRLRTLTGADMSYLSLNDLRAGETYVHVTDGVNTEAYRSIRMPLGTGILGAVAAGGTAVQTQNYLGDFEMNHLSDIDEIVRGEGAVALLGAPLRVGGRIVGALLIGHRTTTLFSRATAVALEHMATQAAVALEQTRLVTEIQRLNSHVGSTETMNAERQRELEDVLRLDERLLGALVASSGPVGVIDILGESTGASVGLYDPLGRLMAGDEVATAEDLADWATRSAIDASAAGGAAVTVARHERSLIVAASSAGDEHLGTLILSGVGKQAYSAMLERASVFVSTMLLLERTISDANNREQTVLIEDLLAARPDEQLAVRTRLLQYGLSVTGSLAVFVIAVTDAARYPAMAAVRDGLGSSPALVSQHAGHICAVVSDDDAEAVAQRVMTMMMSHSMAPLIGYSVSSEGIEGVPNAHVEAHHVVAAQKSLGWESGFADTLRLGVAGMMLSGVDTENIGALVSKHLGPLQKYDAENGTVLVETAWAYLENGSRLAPTAAQLHVHPNTVRQRAERIDAVLGAQWREPSTSVDVHFSLRLARLM